MAVSIYSSHTGISPIKPLHSSSLTGVCSRRTWTSRTCTWAVRREELSTTPWFLTWEEVHMIVGHWEKGDQGPLKRKGIIRTGYRVCGRTKGRADREVSGKEDSSTCYRLLFQMKSPFLHWGLVSIPQILGAAPVTPVGQKHSHEDMWKEIKEMKLTVGLLS